MNRPVDRDKLVMALCDRLVAKSATERTTFLDELGTKDMSLRREVEELLASIENSGQFLVLDGHSEEL